MNHEFLLLDEPQKEINGVDGQITLNELNDALEGIKRTQNYQLMLLIGIIVLLLNKK